MILGLRLRGDGGKNGGWGVFITERGGKFDVARYNNETDACLDLLNRVVHMER